MAGIFARSNDGSVIVHVHLPDGEGSAIVGRRKYQWTFHNYCGPTFLRADGEPLKIQPSENHPVWPHFSEWLDKRNAESSK